MACILPDQTAKVTILANLEKYLDTQERRLCMLEYQQNELIQSIKYIKEQIERERNK